MNAKIALSLHIVIPTSHFPQVIKKSHKYVIWILICQYLNYLNSFWLILFQILEAYKIPSLQKWSQSKPVKTFQCITHVIFPCLVKRNYITSFTKIKTKKNEAIMNICLWEVIFRANKPTREGVKPEECNLYCNSCTDKNLTLIIASKTTSTH